MARRRAFANLERYAESEDIDEVFEETTLKWDPGEDDPPKDLKTRWLYDHENGKDTEETTQNGKVFRHRLRREDFLHHGFKGASARVY